MKVKLVIAGAVAALALLPGSASAATHIVRTGGGTLDYANPCGGPDIVIPESALLEVDIANNDQTDVNLTLWGSSGSYSTHTDAAKTFRHSASSYSLPFTTFISQDGHPFVKVTGQVTVTLGSGDSWSFSATKSHLTCMDDGGGSSDVLVRVF